MGLVQKAFSDIITFSRSSNATRIGPNGLVQYAPHNLVLQSQTFDNASWTKTSSSVTANAAASPDGTVTADKLITNAATSNGYVTQGVSLTSGTTYTFSCYAKTAGATNVRLRASGSGTWASAIVDLTTGVISGTLLTGTATATNVGNGWYRITITAASDLTGSNTFWVYDYNTGDGINGIYIWGAQLSVGPLPLDYTPTTSAAVYGPRFDYDGSGVTAVQPIARNLLLQSEDFNTTWALTRANVTTNVIASPDGTVTADKLYENTTASNTHYVAQTLSLTSGATYTSSVYAKAGERTIMRFRATGTGTWADAYFNLATGTVVSGTGTITSVGNGWYRCSISGASDLTGTNNCVIQLTDASGNATYTGDGTSGLYLWGAQLEIGSTATDYMVSGATNGFRAAPIVTGSATARGLLVEEQRTNLLLYSEEFDNAAWTIDNITKTANTNVAPDGTVTADSITESATTANHRTNQSIAKAASAITYTASVYAKTNGRNIRVSFDSGSTANSVEAGFNLTSGTISVAATAAGTFTNPSASITSIGNGWYRCTITGTTGTELTVRPNVWLLNGTTQNYTGDGTSGIFVWGAQLEAGSFATSYIPTLASTVTRSADVASVNTLTPWYNQSEGSLYTEAVSGGDSASYKFTAELTAAGRVDAFAIAKDSSNLVRYQAIGASGTGFNSTDGSWTVGTVFKTAIGMALNSSLGVKNGGTAVTGATPTVLPIPVKMGIGQASDGTLQFNGHIRRLAYYPRKLSSAELQALTA